MAGCDCAMSLSVAKAAFSKALDSVSSVIKAKASIPVLSYVKLEADTEGGVNLTSTDLDCFYRRSVEADVNVDFSCLLPVRMVKEWLAGVGSGKLAVMTVGQKIRLKVGSNAIEIASLDVKDFPEFPKVAKALLAKADFAPVAAVMSAAPDSDARLELYDVPIHPAPEGLMACAANGRMASTHKFDGIIYGEAVIHIIPPMVGHVARLGLCEVHDCGSFTSFTGDGFTFLVKKLAAKTISITEAIKKWNYDASALLIREELLEAIACCHVLRGLNENEFPIISGEEGGLKISCKSKLGDFESSLDAKLTGNFTSIQLPSRDLLAALRGSEEETVTLSTQNPVVNARLEMGATNHFLQGCKW
jgi:DNA polymerase III sliding clamp (beta) subunit (PCNA family)